MCVFHPRGLTLNTDYRTTFSSHPVSLISSFTFVLLLLILPTSESSQYKPCYSHLLCLWLFHHPHLFFFFKECLTFYFPLQCCPLNWLQVLKAAPLNLNCGVIVAKPPLTPNLAELGLFLHHPGHCVLISILRCFAVIRCLKGSQFTILHVF